MGSVALIYLAVAVVGAVYVGYSLRGLGSTSEKRRLGSALGVQFGSVMAVGGLAAASFWGYQWLTH